MESKCYIQELITQFSAESEKKAFFICDTDRHREITYSQFGSDILKISNYLLQNNIKKQNIALIYPTSYELFTVFFGILASGNIAVVLNPSLPHFMLNWQCNTADVTIGCSTPDQISEWKQDGYDLQWLTFEQMQTAAPLALDEVYLHQPDETAVLMFTSGTTGKSKAVEITFENLRVSAQSADVMYAVKGMENAFSAVPRYHIAGLRGAITCFHHHNTLNIGRGLKYLFMDMPVINPTSMVMVPLMVENVVKLLKRMPDENDWVKYIGKYFRRINVGGATLKPSTTRYLIEKGFTVDISYAMTETTGSATWCVLGEDHINSIGKPLAGTQLRIKDGEILIKGPTVMKGYYKDPEETAKVMEDGWLHTGDMGYCDENGYYYLTGRKKNVIILSNGENVNPEEIEAKFSECDAIAECLVYGDGKGICADIYTQDQAASAEFIQNYNESVPSYRQVYKVMYSAEPLEKTGSGKIKRKENVYV